LFFEVVVNENAIEDGKDAAKGDALCESASVLA